MTAGAPNVLTPFFKELAKKELGETSEHVPAHLVSFKRWLATSPHLKVPQNDDFLLSFLRYAHYDHATAQKRLDNFCTLRCSDSHTSQWYDYPNLDDPILDVYLNAGIFLPLGFISNGMYLVLIRLGAWSPTELCQKAMRTLNNMNFERLLFDPRCQVGGFVFFIDMSHTSMEQAKQWTDMKNAKSAFKLMQEASPARAKHLIFYNESRLFDIAFKLCELWLSEKMRQRVQRLKDDINKAFKKIPGLKDVLPKEYEGTNGNLDEAIERCGREMKSFYANGFPLNCIEVDESKRPPSARNYMKEYKEFDGTLMGSSGTYVKIDPGD